MRDTTPAGQIPLRNRSLALLVGLLLGGVAQAETVLAEATATRLTAQNVRELQAQGPDATGGIGDWHLSNGTLCATISDLTHESDLSARGGALVDLGYCGRADDQLVVMQDLLNGSVASPVNVTRIEAQHGQRENFSTAGIRTISSEAGLLVETLFQLDTQDSGRLKIHKTIARTTDDAPDFFAYVPLFFNYFSMETFVLSTADLSASTGFTHQSFFDRGASAFGRASVNADTVIALGEPDSAVPIAYGWRLDRAERITADGPVALPTFVLSDRGSTARLIAADTFYLGDGQNLSSLQLMQLPLLGLDPDETIEIEESMYVGAGGDVASITNKLFSDAPILLGQVNNPAAVVHIRPATGGAYSFARTDDTGQFSLRVPPGEYELLVQAPGGVSTTQTITQAAGGTKLAPINLAAPAILQLPRGAPMRLVFKGLNETPDPNFEDALTNYSVFDEDERRTDMDQLVPAIFLAGIDSDRERVAIAPGHYRVYATRGIEYGLVTKDILIAAGETLLLEIQPPSRAVQSPGYIAADFHVHSAPSMDNGFATAERVRTFVAEHGEVMVAAEHENMFDFTPLIKSMGVEEHMVAITGTEMTGQVPTARMPHTAGHMNFFPMKLDRDAYRRGVPNNEGRRLRDILFEIRQQQPNVVTQLNHARQNDKFLQPWSGDAREMIDNGAYLDHMGPAAYPYNPALPIDQAPNNTLVQADPITGTRDIDFDAMEILNGPHEWSPTRRNALLTDWFSFLNQGFRIKGTANSDSHNKAQQVALPRTMVALEQDSIDEFSEVKFVQSIHAGNLYGTTGPLLNVTLEGVPMGSTFTGQRGNLQGSVHSADWISATSLQVRINGSVVHQQELASNGEFSIPLEFDQDAWVLLEVEGPADEVYRTLFPRQVPYAFSNPIYVDANADGQWQAPGLKASKN